MNEEPLPRAIGEILHEPIGQGAEGRERIFAAFARFAAVATLEKEKQGYRLRTRATQSRLNIIFTLPKGLFRLISNIENEVRQMNKTETKLYL
ncbi:MAG: hypothetical protein RSG50_09000, partial [Clostridia bacterium]